MRELQNRMEPVFNVYFSFIFVWMKINLQVFPIRSFMRFESYYSFLPEEIATVLKVSYLRRNWIFLFHRDLIVWGLSLIIYWTNFYRLSNLCSESETEEKRKTVKFQTGECELCILEDALHIIKASMKCCRFSTVSNYFGELITEFTAVH
jgi:hypothetical protein